jgi:hypothetical protein
MVVDKVAPQSSNAANIRFMRLPPILPLPFPLMYARRRRCRKAGITPRNFGDTEILRLRVPDAGIFVVVGRVLISNADGDRQSATARLTAFDGAIELDRADVRIGKGGDADSVSISLRGSTFRVQHEKRHC